MGWNRWLHIISRLKREENMSYEEVADRLQAIALHLRWYEKTKLKKDVECALKEG